MNSRDGSIAQCIDARRERGRERSGGRELVARGSSRARA